jgi:ribose transport system substrate-binding protein
LNRFFVLSAVLFGFLFTVVLFFSFGTLRSFPVAGSGEDGEGIRYSFAIFLPDKDYLYYQRIRQGINDRARELNCAVSFYPADSGAVRLDLIPRSGFDGAAYYPLGDQEAVQERIREVVDSSFPLVLIEHLLPTDPTLYMVGTNSYDVGRIIADLVQRSRSEEPRIAFFYSEKNPGLLADRQTLELGLRLSLDDKEYSIFYDETNSNPLDAEMRVNAVLRDHPETNLLIFTDPNDTMAALQVIVDRNLVGKMEIIGFGEDPTIRDYIDKGVLGGAVVPNSYRIGIQVIQTLYEIAETGSSSVFSDVDAYIITGEDGK